MFGVMTTDRSALLMRT